MPKTLFERMSDIARGEREVACPYAGAVWREIRARGLKGQEAELLLRGGEMRVQWTPPIDFASPRLDALPDETVAAIYRFRLHYSDRSGEWHADGIGPGDRDWLPVEGPFDLARPGWDQMDRLRALLLDAVQL